MDPLPQRIEDWAKKNEFKIVSAERRRFFVGPFMLQKNVGHVYRVVVRGRDDDAGEGWLSLKDSLFGKEWEEVKWSRKPAHTVESRPEDVVAQLLLGLGTMKPGTGKWGFGFFMALMLIVWGLASLAYGRLVIPSRRSIAFEGISGLLLALTLVSFGLCAHLFFFWGINPKVEHISRPGGQVRAKVFILVAIVGLVCLVLGLGVGSFAFLRRLAA